MKSKLAVCAAHVLVSALLAACAAALIFFVWYPGSLAQLMRGERLFTLITVCDVALGPLLTLVVYDPAKSRRALLLDYTVIAAIQVAALVYGAGVIAQSRPAYVVFAIDRYELVSAIEVEPGPAASDVPAVSWFGPRLAELRLPTEARARNEAMDLELQGHLLTGMPRYLHPYRHAAALAKAQPVATLLQRFPQRKAEVEAAAARSGHALQELSWLPVKTRFGFHTALLAPGHEGVLAFIELDPY